MVWKQIANSDSGTASIFGGMDIDKISQLFSGVDVDDLDINSNTDFRDDKLQISNPANNFAYTFRTSAIAANREITLPLLTAADQVTFDNHPTSLMGKTIDLCEFANASSNVLKFGYANPYLGNLTGATLRRYGIWMGDGTSTAQGLLGFGMTVLGTHSHFRDTTEGKGGNFATGAVADANGGLNCTSQAFRREWSNYMILRVGFSSTSDVRVFIGFSSSTAAIAGETTLNTLSGVGVGKRTGDTNWFTYRNNASATETRVDTGIAFATSFVTIELQLDSTNFRSRIGGTENTAETTLLPAATTNLAFHCEIETGAGAADKTITILPIFACTGG